MPAWSARCSHGQQGDCRHASHSSHMLCCGSVSPFASPMHHTPDTGLPLVSSTCIFSLTGTKPRLSVSAPTDAKLRPCNGCTPVLAPRDARSNPAARAALSERPQMPSSDPAPNHSRLVPVLHQDTACLPATSMGCKVLRSTSCRDQDPPHTQQCFNVAVAQVPQLLVWRRQRGSALRAGLVTTPHRRPGDAIAQAAGKGSQ